MITAPQAQVLRILKSDYDGENRGVTAGNISRRLWPGKRAWWKAGQMLWGMYRRGLVFERLNGRFYWHASAKGLEELKVRDG